MDTEDLKKFLVVAEKNNLHIASAELSITPGALSKTIKRIENKLNTQLFDRIGRHIHLNQQGEKFRQYALYLVHEADQAISEFNGARHNITVKVSGPSLLLQHYLPKVISQIHQDNYEFGLEACWEGQAISRVATGQAHLGMVTRFALDGSSHSADFARIPLGSSAFKIVAATQHPLWKQHSDGKLTISELSQFGFACPNVSPFCGIKRGVGSDGWQDQKIPRTIAYRCNDFSVLMSLVKQGLALAYVPDFVAVEPDLNIVHLMDLKHHAEEHIEVIYKPSLASGWLNRLTGSIAHGE